MMKYWFNSHRLGMSILLAGSMLFVGGCASDDTDQASTTGKSVEAAAPAPAAKDSIDGQTATITLTGATFDITTVRVKPGVVTLRLKNSGETAVRLAIRQDKTVLVEGDPASGAQLSEVTMPVEAGNSYEYYLAGSDIDATGSIQVVS